MMHVLHPDLKVNYPLDMHFLKHLKQHKGSLLDENAQMSYKNVLIDNTRDLFNQKIENEHEWQQKVL